MTRIRVSGASGSSENTIIFIPAGGHSHDGVTSSLISTEKYSIYDFSPTFVNSTQSQTRAIRQENNRLAFESLVVNIVNQSVLVPAGIRLAPDTLNASAIMANTITAVHVAANTITADEIAANTITANELSSNIILVNNIIRSNSFQSGVGGNGWQIEYDGSAEFNDVVVRGNVFSTVGSIGGWTLSSNSINSGNTYLYSNGAITNGNFAVSNTGVLTAIGANITGSVTAGNTSIYANGQITNGNFSVSNTGVLTATGASFSGTITGTTTSVADIFIQKSAGGRFYRTYMEDAYLQIKRTQSDYFTATGSGAFLGYFNASTVADDSNMVVNSTTPFSSGTFVQASSSGNLTATGTITAAGFSGSISGGSVSATSVDSSGTITANSAEFRRLGGTITAIVSGGIAAWWGSTVDGGFLRKAASSSLRYKTDITEVTDPLLDPKKLLDLNIVQYKYKDGVLAEDDPANGEYLVGFIAEDMYEKYKIGATLDDQGRPEAWNYLTLIPAMMSLIKDLNNKVIDLENQILKNNKEL